LSRSVARELARELGRNLKNPGFDAGVSLKADTCTVTMFTMRGSAFTYLPGNPNIEP
jgi:hypothetical protein